MPIINRGHYSLDTIFDRQVGNDWPTAQVISTADVIEASTNLYYTDERSSSNTINLMQSFQGDNIVIEANGRISASVFGVEFAANATQANTVLTISNFTTDDLAEGSNNLYYTNARVAAYIDDNVTTSNIAEGDNLYYTNARVASNIISLMQSFEGDGIEIEANGRISANVQAAQTVASINNFTTDDLNEGSANLYFTNTRVLAALEGQDINLNNLTVNGDLTVQGNTVTLNTATLVIEDKNIVLANGAADAATADGAGITIDGADANITYREAGDKIEINKNVSILGDLDITGNISGNGIIIRGIEVSDAVLSGNVIAEGGVTGNTIAVDLITANIWNNLYTANVIETSDNLYFSNTRARQAFTAGRGIIIQENGLIKSTDDSDLYNLAINGSVPYIVTDSMETAVTFPTVPAEDRFILRSMHVTNISETDAFISGNILYASGNTAFIADMMPLPLGGTLEFLKKTQVMQPGDKINLQSFDNTGTPASNILSSIFTYETLAGEQDFFGTGLELNAGNVNTLVYTADQSYTILESIKLVNLEDYVIRAKVFWADANDTPRAYFSYNLPLPPNSSVELLQAPKRIEFTDKIYVNYIANSELSVFISGRIGSLFTLDSFTGNVDPGSNVEASFSTTEDEGTVLYYSIE